MHHCDVTISRDHHAAVVLVTGELDAATAPRLRDALIGLIDGGVRTVTVDLAQLRFIGSIGLSVLMAGQRLALDHGGEFALRSPSASALRMFEIAGLTELFTIGQEVPDPQGIGHLRGPPPLPSVERLPRERPQELTSAP